MKDRQNKHNSPGERVEQAITKFSRKHPEVNLQRLTFDTPEAKRDFIKRYMASQPKHPEQIVAYETDFQNFTREQWTFERNFLLRAFERGMFNKIFYTCPDGGGELANVTNKKDLSKYLADIDRGFEKNPQGNVRYSIGMNLEMQGYDSNNQTLRVESDWKKFKGLK